MHSKSCLLLYGCCLNAPRSVITALFSPTNHQHSASIIHHLEELRWDSVVKSRRNLLIILIRLSVSDILFSSFRVVNHSKRVELHFLSSLNCATNGTNCQILTRHASSTISVHYFPNYSLAIRTSISLGYFPTIPDSALTLHTKPYPYLINIQSWFPFETLHFNLTWHSISRQYWHFAFEEPAESEIGCIFFPRTSE